MKTGPIYSITEHEDKCDTATPIDAGDVLIWNNTSEGFADWDQSNLNSMQTTSENLPGVLNGEHTQIVAHHPVFVFCHGLPSCYLTMR